MVLSVNSAAEKQGHVKIILINSFGKILVLVSFLPF